MSRQAECAVTGKVLSGPEKGRISKAGCAWWMPAEAPATAGWLVLASSVFLVLAARWLWTGHRVVSAGSGLSDESRWLLAQSGDCVAASRLAVPVCAPDELSHGKNSSDWLAHQRSASLFAVASDNRPNGRSRCCGPRSLASIVVGSHNYIYYSVPLSILICDTYNTKTNFFQSQHWHNHKIEHWELPQG
jgi:hypothetical protein